MANWTLLGLTLRAKLGEFFQRQVSISHFKQTSKAFEYEHRVRTSHYRASNLGGPHTRSHLSASPLSSHWVFHSFACFMLCSLWQVQASLGCKIWIQARDENIKTYLNKKTVCRLSPISVRFTRETFRFCLKLQCFSLSSYEASQAKHINLSDYKMSDLQIAWQWSWQSWSVYHPAHPIWYRYTGNFKWAAPTAALWPCGPRWGAAQIRY